MHSVGGVECTHSLVYLIINKPVLRFKKVGKKKTYGRMRLEHLSSSSCDATSGALGVGLVLRSFVVVSMRVV